MTLITTKSRQQTGLAFALLVAVIVIGSALEQAVAIPAAGYGVLWPTTGLLTGVLLIVERRHWPAILLLFLIVESIFLGVGHRQAIGIADVVQLLVSYAVIVSLCTIVRRRYPDGLRLHRLAPDLRDFFAMAIAISVFTGLVVFVFSAFLDGLTASIPKWHGWVLYDFLSIVIIASMLLAWTTPPPSRRHLSQRSAIIEVSLLALALVAVLGFELYGPPGVGRTSYDFVWGLVLWGLFRFDLRVVTTIMAITACYVSWKLAGILGSIGGAAGDVPSQVVEVAAYIAVAASVSLILNALISGDRKLQSALQSVAGHMRELVRTTRAHVWVFNSTKGEMEFMTASESELWRLPALRNGSGKWLEMVHPDDRPAIQANWSLVTSGTLNRPMSTVYRMYTQDDGICWKRTFSMPLPALADDDQRFAGVMFDVTDEHKLNQEMQNLTDIVHESDKLHALGALSAGLAHDLNNMLMIMMGEVASLQDNSNDAEEVLISAKAIENVVEKGREITGQLMQIARRETTKPCQCELGREVSKAASLLKRAMPENIELNIDIDVDPESRVLCRNPDLTQLILNLGINARDAIGSDNGTVTIDTHAPRSGELFGREQPVAVVMVCDDGHGLDGESLERAFEPLFTTKAAEGGTGLGLSVVNNIVRSLGGEIDIESKVGKGTDVTVTLPLSGELG